jgi:hypothetical protein
MTATAIAAMMDLRDLRDGRGMIIATITITHIIMITDMAKAKGKRERGVRMHMRRCRRLRVVGLRRTVDIVGR